MSFDSEPFPVLQFLLDMRARGFWQQAQGMAAEIDAVGTRGRLRNVETIAIRRERIGGGHRLREIAAVFELEARHLESLQRRKVALDQVICFLPVEIFDA